MIDINYFDIIFNVAVAILVPISFYFTKNFKDVFYVLLILSVLKLLIIYFLIEDHNIKKFLNLKYLNKKPKKVAPI